LPRLEAGHDGRLTIALPEIGRQGRYGRDYGDSALFCPQNDERVNNAV
jgi:hypothetical protein